MQEKSDLAHGEEGLYLGEHLLQLRGDFKRDRVFNDATPGASLHLEAGSTFDDILGPQHLFIFIY